MNPVNSESQHIPGAGMEQSVSPRNYCRAEAALLPFISIVVPVRNEEAFIQATLEQLDRQDYPADRFEVIVADGDSTDRTPEIAARFMVQRNNFRLLHNPARLASAARNLCVREGRGELFVIIDGHCEIANRQYLRELASAFERSGADCIGRPQPLDIEQASPLQSAIAAARSSWFGHHPSSWIYASSEAFVAPQSVAAAYRKSVFKKVGLFDESFDACEDVEFNYRVHQAGLRCFFTPKIRVRYFPRSTLRQLFKQMVRYGRGRIRLLRKQPRSFSISSFVPLAFLVFVAAGPLFICFWPRLTGPYAAVLGLYAFFMMLATLQAGLLRANLAVFLRLPAVFLTIHIGAAVGAFQELLAAFGRRKIGQTPTINTFATSRAETELNVE